MRVSIAVLLTLVGCVYASGYTDQVSEGSKQMEQLETLLIAKEQLVAELVATPASSGEIVSRLSDTNKQTNALIERMRVFNAEMAELARSIGPNITQI